MTPDKPTPETPLSAEDALTSIEAAIDGRFGIYAIGHLIRRYKASRCEQRLTSLVRLVKNYSYMHYVDTKPDEPVTIEGAPLTFCPFCGGKLPEHNV